MLDQSLIPFEDLDDLLKTLDEYMELHQDALQRYGDRLRGLLRMNKGTGDQLPSATQSKDVSQKRRGSDKEPWTVFKLDQEGNTNLRIANTSLLAPSAAENTILFRIIESLRVKLQYLEEARKKIAELPTLGHRANQRFLVAFADGLPKQVIPTDQSYSSENRFQFNEDFVLEMLDDSEDLVQA